jgi:hypothetical protein
VATAFPQAPVELWGMGATDEQRMGLKPLLRRVWAPMGQRPVATVQHRFAWRSLVGFVHPASGRTVFHLATTVSIPVFAVELAAFARQVGASPSQQIVLVLDPGPRGLATYQRPPPRALTSPTTCTCSSCRPIPRNCSQPSTCGR